MSVQETKLTAIADAIREREGSTEPIPAGDFAARILALPGGSGTEGFAVPLVVTVEQGAEVAAVQGDTAITGTSGADGTVTLILTAPGEWTVTASLNGKQKETSVTVGNGYEAVLRMSTNLPEGVTLPDGYVELEYIDNSNLGYVSSWPHTPATSYFEAKIDFLQYPVSGGFFGGTGWNYKTKYKWGNGIMLTANSEGDISAAVSYSSSYSVSTSPTSGNSFTTVLTLNEKHGPIIIKQMGTESLSLGGAEKAPLGGSAGTNVNQAFLALGTYSRRGTDATETRETGLSPLKIRLYYFYFGKNNEYGYFPCKNPDGEVGLYCPQSAKFYKSSAADKPFVAGPVV